MCSRRLLRKDQQHVYQIYLHLSWRPCQPSCPLGTWGSCVSSDLHPCSRSTQLRAWIRCLGETTTNLPSFLGLPFFPLSRLLDLLNSVVLLTMKIECSFL